MFNGIFFMSRAREVLEKVRQTEDGIDEEIQGIIQTCKEDDDLKKTIAEGDGSSNIWIRILTTQHVRRALLVGCVLQAINQLCGINTIMYYSATIIKMSGVEDESLAIWLTAVTSGVLTISTCSSTFLVERAGRRKLFMGSLTGVCGALLLIAIAFQLSDYHSTPIYKPSHENYSSAIDLCLSYDRCVPCTNDGRCGLCRHYHNGSEISICVPVDPRNHENALGDTCAVEWLNNQTSSFILSEASDSRFYYDVCPATTQTQPYSILVIIAICIYLTFFGAGKKLFSFMGENIWNLHPL